MDHTEIVDRLTTINVSCFALLSANATTNVECNACLNAILGSISTQISQLSQDICRASNNGELSDDGDSDQ